MRKVVGKLKCKRGASIAIALIIFLLCALAGASAFIMSASNVGRYSHSDEQEYYSSSSAALMLVDMLDGLTYESATVKYVYERKWDYVGDEQHVISDGYTLNIPSSSARGNWSENSGANTIRSAKLKLCSTILDRCNDLIPYFVPNEWYDGVKGNTGIDIPKKPANDLEQVSYSFTVTVPNDDRFGTVKCTLTMNTSYDLNFTFSGENGEYAISVYWQADLTQDKTSGEDMYDYTTQTDGKYLNGSLTHTDELKITAKWKKKNVTISRGAVQ